MDTLRLNYDVLLDIVAQCDSHETALAVMSSCRFLYKEGTKYLLRNPIEVETEERLLSLLTFLLPAEPSGIRPQHVQELTLHTEDFSSRAANMFSSVCPLMTGLKSFTMSNVEKLMASHPDLIVGLAQLKHLNHLSLSEAGTEVCKLLMLLRAPLKTISVRWSTMHWYTIHKAHWPQWHPTTLLENFAETLEELTCVGWFVCEEYIPPRKVYPRLRRLSIIEFAEHFILAPFIQAFPHLTHISVDDIQNYETHAWDGCDRQDNHKLNIAHQQAAPSVGGGTWQNFQEFSGFLVDLYAFGLACHVPRLIIEDDFTRRVFKSSDKILVYLAEMLSYTCPEYLDYSSYSYIGDNGVSTYEFDGLGTLATGLRKASAPARSRLTTLIVRITFRQPDANFPGAMEDLASAIQGLSLRVLKLMVEERIIKGFDLVAFARRLVDGMPSLQETVVVSNGPVQGCQSVTPFVGRGGLGRGGVVAGCQ